MEHISQKELEQKHYTTFKNVFITLLIILALVIITSVILIEKGYPVSFALVESFHIITHFPKYSYDSLAVSFLSIAGAFLGFYIIVTLMSIIYGGGLKYELMEGRKMSKINKLKNHVIICGANTVGNNVAVKLDAENIPFVIVDDNIRGLAEPRAKGFLVIEGSPLEEDDLLKARIKHADVLVAVLEQEGANMLLASLAKKLNPNLKVIAKTDHYQFVEHMEKIGADLVMMPDVLGAFKIADVVQDILEMKK